MQIDGERVLDFHTHVFPSEIVQARERYFPNEPWFESLYAPPRSRLATADDLARAMADDGIAAAVALNFAWRDPGLCRDTNDSIVEACRPYRQIVPFCMVVPGAAGAADEVARCAALGFRGIGELNAEGQQFDITDEQIMRPIVEACREHGMVLLLHASEPVGHTYPGKGTVSPGKLVRFLKMAQGVSVVFAHWGGGLLFYELMPEIADLTRHTYYDAAATPYLYKSQVYATGSQICPSRVLFGSDFPLMPQQRALKYLEESQLEDEQRRAILWDNGARLLGLA